MKYNWTFANVGGTTRVKIQSGEDIRHLGELDQKMWTVLSCPTTGLEINEESLKLIDLDGDGKLRVKEVIQTADWLCSVLRDPETLLASKAEVPLANIADETILAVAKQVSADGQTVTLADVETAIAAVSVETQPAPEAPFEGDVIAAYKAKQADYAAYFEQAKLQSLGLATIAEDTPKPGLAEADFAEMGTKIAAYEAGVAIANEANAAALSAAQAQYQPLRKLLLLSRDFYRLLRNFITFEDFYDKAQPKAIFQAGTLIIDQRGQAFWSPYRKFGAWVTDLINKSAAEKDSKVFSEATNKVQEKKAEMSPLDKKKMETFDIAKFAGIFAAIGMAIGYIGAFFTSVIGGFASLKWWQDILAVLGIVLVISGPSMFLAWTKLRKRNLAPVLNANGWAVNADVMVNVMFGSALTQQAQFPMLQLVDPLAKKGMPAWKKWIIVVASVLVVLLGLWLTNLLNWCKLPSPLPCFNQEVAEQVEPMVETVESAETVVVEEVAE